MKIKKCEISLGAAAKIFARNMIIMVSIVILTTIIAFVIDVALADKENISVIYILSVVVVCCTTDGYFYGILAAFLGIIGVNFFFMYPYFEFNFILAGYPITFMIMLVAALITSTLTNRVKQQAVMSKKHEQRTLEIYRVTTQLFTTDDTSEMVALIANSILELFSCSVAVWIGSPMSSAPYLALYDLSDADSMLEEKENFAAYWAYSNVKDTGVGTDSCLNAKWYYIPIVCKSDPLGVVGVNIGQKLQKGEEDKLFLKMIVSQVAIAIERQALSKQEHETTLRAEKEKMRSNLLRAISHDLRTPLTAIIGSSSTILEHEKKITYKEKRELVSDIKEDAQWLVRMVENLLSVTRIAGVGADLKKNYEAVEEIVAEAASRVKTKYKDCSIHVSVPDELLMVPMDATLIEQVIINLLENALKYAGIGLPISLNVKKNDEYAEFEVSDMGNGIDEEQLPFIFEGYFEKKNISSDANRGMGIGLSICRSIIDAHKGTIYAKNKKTGGAVFTFTLPLKGES